MTTGASSQQQLARYLALAESVIAEIQRLATGAGAFLRFGYQTTERDRVLVALAVQDGCDKILLECWEERAAERRRLRWLDLSAVDRIRRQVFPLSVVEALRESLAVLTSVVD